MQRTLKSMMAAARLLLPDLQGVAVLGGSLEKDAYRRQYERELASSVPFRCLNWREIIPDCDGKKWPGTRLFLA
jgi:hypothetical protein